MLILLTFNMISRSTCNVLYRGQRHHVANLQPGLLSTGTNWGNAKGSSLWPGIRNTTQENNVTLNDVKNVAKNNPIRKETLNSLLFKELYRYIHNPSMLPVHVNSLTGSA